MDIAHAMRRNYALIKTVLSAVCEPCTVSIRFKTLLPIRRELNYLQYLCFFSVNM